MSYRSLSLGISVIALYLAGCASMAPVFYDYDSAQSFDGYRTFAWINDEPMTLTGSHRPSPVVAARLTNAIKNTLEQKGFRFLEDPEQADFVVSFTVGARDQLKVSERTVADFYGSHWRWGYDYFGSPKLINVPRTELTTHKYTEGSLAIDVFDVQRKSPVWHGGASKRLSRAELQGQGEDSSRIAVETIMAKFPPNQTSRSK